MFCLFCFNFLLYQDNVFIWLQALFLFFHDSINSLCIYFSLDLAKREYIKICNICDYWCEFMGVSMVEYAVKRTYDTQTILKSNSVSNIEIVSKQTSYSNTNTNHNRSRSSIFKLLRSLSNSPPPPLDKKDSNSTTPTASSNHSNHMNYNNAYITSSRRTSLVSANPNLPPITETQLETKPSIIQE